MSSLAWQLSQSHPLLSDQVTTQQIEVILGELERVLRTDVAGDIVEMGCYIGTTSVFIRRLLDTQKEQRQFHVYDSFEGLPAKSDRDSSSVGKAFTAGELAVSKKQFLQSFTRSRLQVPIIHKGWFNQLEPEDLPPTIAFVFLDGDFYESIRDSLKLVVPRISPGGTIVVDDYAREALPGAAKAVHEFFPPENVRVVSNLGIIHM